MSEPDRAEDVEMEAVSDESIEDTDIMPTDEAEPITEEEAASCTIPLAMAKGEAEEVGHLASTVCQSCLELNLLTKTSIACARCGQAFCLHFASTVDAQYCVNCMSDIEMTKQTITKSYEHSNPETGQRSFYRRKAREVQIKGLDWLFAQRKINDMADVELDLAIEYHRNIESLMIAEQERRRNAKMHRYAGVSIKIPSAPGTEVRDTKTTTVKKSRTISKNKQAEQLAALLKSMMAKGVDINSLAEKLGK